MGWFGVLMAPQNNDNSNIKDQWAQITITNIIIMKKFEILWELPKCERHEVSKCWWRNGADKLAWRRVATSLVCKKHSIWKMQYSKVPVKQGMPIPWTTREAEKCSLHSRQPYTQLNLLLLLLKTYINTGGNWTTRLIALARTHTSGQPSSAHHLLLLLIGPASSSIPLGSAFSSNRARFPSTPFWEEQLSLSQYNLFLKLFPFLP